MSTHKPKQGSDYRITLTDIRGVGGKTLEKLNSAGIESIEDVHLLRKPSGSAYSTLQSAGVGSDTLEHLEAVGSAVFHRGSDRVKAKHLTGSIADEKELDSFFVDITADTEDPEEDTSQEPTFDPDMDQLGEAIVRIQSEYPEGYGNQVSFEADINRHVHESERFNEDHGLTTGLVQSIVRYRHDGDTFASQGDYEPYHGSLLISFSNSLE